MTLQSLSLHNVRSHALSSFAFSPQVTLVLGANGSGKTTLLEAVHYLYRGNSFRGGAHDLIKHDETIATIKLSHAGAGDYRGQIIRELDGSIRKEFTLADKTSARLPQAARLPVVLFEPDELRLLSSSPQRRREFVDSIIARLSPTYSRVLSRYARTLAQRNELLKQYDHMSHAAWQSHLFAWDVKLAELGASITKARRNFLAHANQHLSRLYSELADAEHTTTARYISLLQTGAPASSDTQLLLNALERAQQADALRGFTSVGPHRDDIILILNNTPASETASRGEMRTIMLAFKLLEVELQQHHSGQKPLILLDDVFSELDIAREQKLIHALSTYQTIITATDLRDELKTTATIINL